MRRGIKRTSLVAIFSLFVTGLLSTAIFQLIEVPAMAGGPVTEAAVIKGALLPLPPAPQADEAKVELGRRLFNDPRLSHTNSISCRSCHDLSFYGADSRSLSTGFDGKLGTVNAPTVFNSVFNFRQFWDGRARTLKEQVAGPVHNPVEMGSDWPEVVAKLNEDAQYKKDFASLYGHPIDSASIIDAISEFESQLVTPNAPFDRYLKGDTTALTAQQIMGFRKFEAFGCVACHQGRQIGGNMYQTLGVMGDYFQDRGGHLESDNGRFNVTKDPKDLHIFKVPSLRNVMMTGPYFHDGSVKSVEDAVRIMGRYQLGRELTRSDIADLVSFLNALTGERPPVLLRAEGKKP